MADIRRRIERVIEADPVIKKGLQRGIVNSRALARYILDNEGLDSTPDAILGIIRRYSLSDRESSDIRHIFKGCELSLRNKIAELEVEYHQDTMNRVAEFASNHKTARGENVKLVLGLRFIRVITDQNSLEGLRKTLQPGEIIGYSRDLTEITIHLPPAAHMTKGIVAKVTTELFLNGINLAGIVECAPELTLIVAEIDAPRALEALQRMLKEDAASLNHAPPLSRSSRVSRKVIPA